MSKSVFYDRLLSGYPLRHALHEYRARKRADRKTWGERLELAEKTVVSISIFMLKFYVIKKIFIDGVYSVVGFEKTILLLMALTITLLKFGGGAKT